MDLIFCVSIDPKLSPCFHPKTPVKSFYSKWIISLLNLDKDEMIIIIFNQFTLGGQAGRLDKLDER